MPRIISGVQVDDSVWSGLRFCQKKAIKTVFRYLQRGEKKRSCLISMPTGSGKSGVISVVSQYISNAKILVLCHRRAVCDQLVRDISGSFFSKVAGDRCLTKKNVYGSIDDTSKDGVYVSTFHKLQSMSSEDLERLKADVDLLIIDEGHSEPSPVWSALSRGLDAHKIIITATPYRNDLFQFDLDPDHSFVYTFERALEDKVLVDPSFHSISHDEILDRVEVALNERAGTKCIVKCKEFSDIEYYFRLFSQRFCTLAVHQQYSGSGSEDTKAKVPSRLSESDYQVIIHQRKLDEGIDIPQAKVLVLTYEVSSGRELVQTVGRVVRIFNGFSPSIFDLSGVSNSRLWSNYREFDSYISERGNSKKFLNSLDTARLIDGYLGAFPDFSYFGAGFKRKFDFVNFSPESSLVIPLASICFVKKKEGFSMEALLDGIYWSLSREGELAKVYRNVCGIGLVISISFNNSKFLKDGLFFEPSFEVFFAKDAGDFVAYFDSRGRDYSYESGFSLGGVVDVSQLFRLAGRGDSVRTREAHARSIGSGSGRPDGVGLRGPNLEATSSKQGGSSYALTTVKVDNIVAGGRRHSSYYLGVGSGRVSDQKNRNFSLSKVGDWIDEVAEVMKSPILVGSEFINSYAKPVNEVPVSDPVIVFVDLSFLDRSISVHVDGYVYELRNDVNYFEYDDGLIIFPGKDDFKLSLSFSDEEEKLIFGSGFEVFYSYSDDEEGEGGEELYSLLDALNESDLKVLYSDGLTYLNGRFYRVSLPSENGFNLDEVQFGRSLISLPYLSSPDLEEKNEAGVGEDEFGENSIFNEVDKLRLVSEQGATREQFGCFYNFIPDVDTVVCTDMGTEPADFILSSPTKLVFVHVKCGVAANPRSAAGALALVGSQAIKNIQMVVTQNQILKPANWNRLLGEWPAPSSDDNALHERIRLSEGARFVNAPPDPQVREAKLQGVWELITQRRRSPVVEKEIWVVVGNGFSRGHFKAQMLRGVQAEGESLQAYQLIESWIATASSLDVRLKILVSP